MSDTKKNDYSALDRFMGRQLNESKESPKLHIIIDITNDAFENNFDDEIEKCLKQVTKELDGLGLSPESANGFSMKIRDTNGNTVGTAEIK